MNPDNKTPRDWLLARHTAATPQLDALRRAALPSPAITWRVFVRELIQPNRAAWRTLAAVWFALVVFHFTIGRADAGRLPDPPPAVFAAWLASLSTHELTLQTDSAP